MVAASVLGSQPPAGTSLFTLPIQPTPFLSSWRWASLSSPQASQAAGRSGSVEFQSTKGTVEAVLPVPRLTTNHSPAFQFCQVLLVRGLMGEERKARGGLWALHSKTKNQTRVGSHLGSWHAGACPVTLDCVWVDGHGSETGAHGMCPFQFGRRHCQGVGRAWQGVTGQWAQACSSDSFSDLSSLFGACPF